jgi:zinc transporter
MSKSEALIGAYIVDSQGQTREVGWDEIRSWRPESGFLWVHLDRRAEKARAWLTPDAQLDSIVTDALLAEETRPRVLTVGQSLLVILRGVNLNPGADPEDMVSVRLWLDAYRVITLRRPKPTQPATQVLFRTVRNNGLSPRNRWRA